jgi:hypothetical protein
MEGLEHRPKGNTGDSGLEIESILGQSSVPSAGGFCPEQVQEYSADYHVEER